MSEKAKLVGKSYKDKPSTSKGYGAIKDPDAYKQFLHQQRQPKTYFTKRDGIIVGVVLLIAILAISLTLIFGLPALAEKRARYYNITTEPSISLLQQFTQSVVATDAEHCAPIGNDILKAGGSAVDAAIATLFCNGAVNPQSMGIGGGLFITIYSKSTKEVVVIDGREVAPAAATEDMFKNSSAEAKSGGLSIAVPGELRAYQVAHGKFGKLRWNQLIEPTIKLCRDGFTVSNHLYSKLKDNHDKIMKDQAMKDLFFNNVTSKLYAAGEVLKRPILATTLEQIALKGADAFYTGALAKQIIDDITAANGIITEADLSKYAAKTRAPLAVKLPGAGVTLHTPPPPGSGPVMSLILNILDGYGYTEANGQTIEDSTTMYQRITEVFKYAYAKRTGLGDIDFMDDKKLVEQLISRELADAIRENISDTETFGVEHYGTVGLYPDNSGTAHVSVLTESGDAVSATSSINSNFGSFVRSPSTDIIFNNHMNDFSSPDFANPTGLKAAPANYIAPGKRPFSSMCPAIMLDQSGNVQMVLGGAGSTRITTGQALIAFRHLYLKQDPKQAVDGPRIHHQLFPNQIFYEDKFPRVVIDNLHQIGHKISLESEQSSFIAIVRNSTGRLLANVDYRKGGSVEGQ